MPFLANEHARSPITSLQSNGYLVQDSEHLLRPGDHLVTKHKRRLYVASCGNAATAEAVEQNYYTKTVADLFAAITGFGYAHLPTTILQLASINSFPLVITIGTDIEHIYNTLTPEDLQIAFQQIAVTLSSISLSQ